MTDLRNQRARILEWLDEFGSITPQEAMVYLGIMRLAARIMEIRQSGIEIICEMMTGVNKFGEKIRYAKYRRAGDEQR